MREAIANIIPRIKDTLSYINDLPEVLEYQRQMNLIEAKSDAFAESNLKLIICVALAIFFIFMILNSKNEKKQ